MALLETLVFSLLLIPVLIFIVTVFILSALGKSLGIRRKYVQLLLYFFEYGKKKIEKARKLKTDDEDQSNNSESDDVYTETESEEDSDGQGDNNTNSKTAPVMNGKYSENGLNGYISSGGDSVRHRRMKRRLNSEKNVIITEKHSKFDLSDSFQFISDGVQAIVEDQVTQRFIAEELKSWNLLTRTNRHYEFISWRLSFIWLVGFLVRYFVLLPIRVTMCIIGTGTLTTLTFFIGLLPESKLKRILNNYASKFSFRLLSRAFSAIVTYHCIENKPTNRGICVANHTSPIDVVLLASDSCYALVLCLTMTTYFVGAIPQYYGEFRRKLYNLVVLQSFEVLAWSISAVVNYHDVENRPGGKFLDENGSIIKCSSNGGGGICVANHTSPIDVNVLAVDRTYAMIGQRHGGFLGILQRALARASSHIWFERSEMKDREAVARRLKEHVEDKTKLPILIFPEGTCINNSAVMQFKKGSFEVGGVIYPVAIKYDPRFGDPFWDSSNYSMLQYLYMMMTSWAIVCDVWYLPPMSRQSTESAVEFANRVKSVIAQKGGLVDLDWDGQLKRNFAKREWREQQQLEYSRKFSQATIKDESIQDEEEPFLNSSESEILYTNSNSKNNGGIYFESKNEESTRGLLEKEQSVNT